MLRGNKYQTEPRRERRFQKGVLKYVILDLINDHPRHGYEIIRTMDERSYGFYAPSPGAVYPTLQSLQETGYITSEEQDDKKVYTITRAGREFLDERREIADGIKRQMAEWWNPERMEEVGKTWGALGKIAEVMNEGGPKLTTEQLAEIRDILGDAHARIEKLIRD